MTTTQIDTRDRVQDQAAPPAPAVGVRTADRRASDGPTLQDLVGDWTWRSHDDRQLRPSDTDRESTSTKAQFVRLFARARMLVGY